jgi:hypothetical protein
MRKRIPKHKRYDEFLDLNFGNKWEYISTLRRFVHNFMLTSLKDKDDADRISLAASELVENAVKYSYRVNGSTPPEIRFLLDYDESGNRVLMNIYNFASEEDIVTLRNEFSRITGTNPYDIYIVKMKEIASRDDGKSMLGLARTVYISGCSLSMDIDGSLVKMAAEFKL